jgi:hypothetical protein
MATFKSHAYVKGTTLRADGQVEPQEATFTITIPDGKGLAQNDILQFGYLGENLRVLEIELDNSASLASSGLTVDIGDNTTGDCFLDGVSFGNGAVTVLKRADGLTADTSANNFADTPYVIRTARSSIVGTIASAVTGATTSGIRTINLRVKYQYPYAESYVSGVSTSAYPLSGSKTVSDAIKFDYNGNT